MKNLYSNIILDDYFNFVNACKKDKELFTKYEFNYPNKNTRINLVKFGNLLYNSNLFFRFKITHDIYMILHILDFNPKKLKFKIRKHTYWTSFKIFKLGHIYENIEMEFCTLNLYFVENELTILNNDNIK